MLRRRRRARGFLRKYRFPERVGVVGKQGFHHLGVARRKGELQESRGKESRAVLFGGENHVVVMLGCLTETGINSHICQTICD